MNPRKACRIVVSGFLALPVLASFAMAQRSADPARPLPPRNPDVKLPATPAPIEGPLVRETRGRAASAPALPKIPELDTNRSSYRAPHDQLYLSTQADGSPQVRGRTFKAEFTPAGATYIPFCGSAAPQSHPLTFRIESISSGGEPVAFADSVVAGLAGETVSYARGGVTEVYALDLDSVEQKFVFDMLPSTGDLVLRLACASDMSAGYDGSAILFSSADGTVRYGAATVVDANGASAPALTELDGQGIGIRVPASFLAAASFPVTIDPVISTFTVTWTTEPVDSFAPAIAWDETNQRYCVAYQEVFSATDNDVIRAFVSPAGVFQSAAYVDTSLSAYWATPDVANNNNANQFYVVAAVGLPTGGARTIHGRTVDANLGTLGADLLVSTADQYGEKINPSVGGDPLTSSAAYYTVVWTRIFSPGFDEDVHMRQVDQTGTLLGAATIAIDNSAGTLDRNPRISKSCQGYGFHHVVWERWVSGTDRDIRAAEVLWDGTITLPSTAIITGAGDTTAPACSPTNNANQWLLVWEYDFISDRDLFASLMTGVTASFPINLSFLESSYAYGTGLDLQDQRHPAADSDGARFAVAYSESYASSATDYDMYVSTLDVISGLLELSEFHKNVAFSTTHEDYPRMCSTAGAGGASWRTATVWSDTGGLNLGDVEAALYDVDDATKLCFPGVNSGVCPCGNTAFIFGTGCLNSSATAASIWQTGTASIASDNAVFYTLDEKPTALSIVTQGSSLVATGLNFGQGRRCAAGTLKRLYLKTAVGGSITAPSGADPSIHVRSAALGDPLSAGSFRYYYVYYRDPIVLGGCVAALTYNATDTVQVLWRP
jgi:hypothetical protein